MVRVRREIRDLSFSEWNTVVRALWVMKNTTTEEGRRLYGPEFISYNAMVSKHMTAGVVSLYALLFSCNALNRIPLQY
jgi:hypothetical protein